MKTYKVLASYTTYCSLVIHAESEDEAREIAYQADGGDFKSDTLGDWNVDDVIEFVPTYIVHYKMQGEEYSKRFYANVPANQFARQVNGTITKGEMTL